MLTKLANLVTLSIIHNKNTIQQYIFRTESQAVIYFLYQVVDKVSDF